MSTTNTTGQSKHREALQKSWASFKGAIQAADFKLIDLLDFIHAAENLQDTKGAFLRTATAPEARHCETPAAMFIHIYETLFFVPAIDSTSEARMTITVHMLDSIREALASGSLLMQHPGAVPPAAPSGVRLN